MSKLIAIDASPNTQKEDIFLILKLLLSPFSWNGNKYSQRLQDYFQQRYNPKVSLVTKSGRAALYLLLSAAIKPGDEVITQAFTCIVVPNAILWVGGKPVFVDIGRHTYNLDPKDLKKKITKKTKAVIIQHTFGIPSNIKDIQKICKENNLLLIEDCAHALGAKYNSKLIGTFGDGAIFSFNQDKVVSGINGGVLIIHNPKLAENFKAKLDKPSNWQTFKTLLHPLLWWVATPVYETFSLGKLLVFIGWRAGILYNTITPQEESSKMPLGLLEELSNPQAALILQGLQRLDKDNRRRQKIAEEYRKELSKIGLHPTQLKSTDPIYMRYPLQVKDPQALVKAARKEGLILGRWYTSPIFPNTEAVKDFYQEGRCPIAEVTGKHIVNLPTFPRLSDNEVDRVINVIKKDYANN